MVSGTLLSFGSGWYCKMNKGKINGLLFRISTGNPSKRNNKLI